MGTNTYRAVQVGAPGKLELVQRDRTPPPPGTVRIRVEACGVCHSDSMTVEGHYPGISYPRVPGHEVAGVIDAGVAIVFAGWQTIDQGVVFGYVHRFGGHARIQRANRRALDE